MDGLTTERQGVQVWFCYPGADLESVCHKPLDGVLLAGLYTRFVLGLLSFCSSPSGKPLLFLTCSSGLLLTYARGSVTGSFVFASYASAVQNSEGRGARLWRAHPLIRCCYSSCGRSPVPGRLRL